MRRSWVRIPHPARLSIAPSQSRNRRRGGASTHSTSRTIHQLVARVWFHRSRMSTARPLSETERAMLDFERESWTFGMPKETSIRAKLGISPTTYYRTINGLIDLRSAYGYDPLTVARLR